MADRLTRRSFAAGVLATGLGAKVGLASPGSSNQDKSAAPHSDLGHLNGQLAKPVPEDLQKAVGTSLKHNDDLFQTRRKHKLKEGSEPTSIFRAKGVK